LAKAGVDQSVLMGWRGEVNSFQRFQGEFGHFEERFFSSSETR